MNRFSQTTAPSTTQSNVASNAPLPTAAGVQWSHSNQWDPWGQWNQYTVQQLPHPVQSYLSSQGGAYYPFPQSGVRHASQGEAFPLLSQFPQLPINPVPTAAVVQQAPYGPAESWSRSKYPKGYIQFVLGLPASYLNEGAYAEISTVQCGATALAVKRSRTDQKEYYRNTLSEAQILKTLDNPYIVNLHGYVADGHQVSMVMPRYQYSLWHYLRDNKLTPAIKAQLCRGITAGVKYIHDQGYIHADLKSSNILIDSCCNPVIADFGMTCKIRTAFYLRKTCFYQAPELSVSAQVRDRGTTSTVMVNKITIEADVFCLGGLILSTMTNYPFNNYWKFKPDGSINITALDNLDHCSQLPIMANIIKPSMHLTPNKRPSVEEIVLELQMVNFTQWPQPPGSRATQV